ncbi:MAG: diguanylate cyclase [Lachnospiraceae bacterium]|nr:diguanylate cyclase [Lachnospiraceae bacterium]
MRSIRTRFVASFVGTILGVFLVLASVGVYYLITAIEYHSAESMNLLNKEATVELDSYFSGVERAVGSLEEYLRTSTNVELYRTDEGYREKLFDALEERAVSSAKIVENVEAVYFRPDPLLYGGVSGFFLTASGDGEYKSLTPTDILAYEEDDVEHVGWYYEPIKNKGPLWMEPYANENISVYMVSYVIPVYLGRDFLGVVGMDINMNLVHEVIDELNYENSTGILFSESGNVLYHRDYPGGLLKKDFTEEFENISRFLEGDYVDSGNNYAYSAEGGKCRITVSRLENRMLLAISTPESALFQLRDSMLFRVGLSFVAALVFVIFVSMSMTKSIVSPIRELTAASSRIAKGELGQQIDYHSQDEIGSLADSIRKISVDLKVYIDYIHEQAYLDAMTGVHNKAAYMAEEARIKRLIRENMAQFSVYVFDVNGLKRMNDTKGHEYGDMMIKDAAQCIREIFGENQIYRIGGDEFVVLGKEEPEKEIRRQFARFDELLRSFNATNDKYEEELAVSKGVAVYDPEIDAEYASVFSRADEAMYNCKAEYYKTHGDRRRRS